MDMRIYIFKWFLWNNLDLIIYFLILTLSSSMIFVSRLMFASLCLYDWRNQLDPVGSAFQKTFKAWKPKYYRKWFQIRWFLYFVLETLIYKIWDLIKFIFINLFSIYYYKLFEFVYLWDIRNSLIIFPINYDRPLKK